MAMLKRKYPFDPSIKNHLIVAVGLVVWIFSFLYFTEPLDVNQLTKAERLLYLPLYGLMGALAYLLVLPLQRLLYERSNKLWVLGSELLVLLAFFLLGLMLVRIIYLKVIVPNEPNPYTLGYFFTAIYLPAISVVLPIISIGRWALGKYLEKQLEDQKICVQGSGNYESLRILEENLISIQSADNYVEVFYMEQGYLKKNLIRNTLTSIEKDLPQLLRCHRGFLVNPSQIKQLVSENGKWKLDLSCGVSCSVSKTFLPQVKQVVSFTTK